MGGEPPADTWAGDERKSIIDALWSDVDDLRRTHDQEQLRRNRRPATKNEMAKATGVSNSTLGDWLNKRTVVPDWPDLERLVRFLGGRPEEWQPRWRRAMGAYQSRPRSRPSTTTSPEPEPSPPPAEAVSVPSDAQAPDGLGGPPARQRRRPPLGVLIAVPIMTLLVVVLLLALRPETSQQTKSSTRQATVVNTWSSSRQRDVGVRPWVQPTGTDQKYPGYFTNDLVTVTCYRTDGRLVTDVTSHETSTVWYQLTDELWLPGLFLQFGDQLGTKPPTDIRIC